MEVHAPHEPILSVRQALVHLAIVTVGILIALSLDGILERVDHRALVREARATLGEEIAGNQTALKEFVARLQVHRQDIVTTIEMLNDLPNRADEATLLFRPGAPPGGKPSNFLRNYALAELRTISRTTAEVTGALALMDYQEVQRYAAVYDRQLLFMRTQDQANSEAMEAFSLGQALDFHKLSATELEAIRRQLRVAFGSTLAEEEFARLLLAEYARALEPAK